MILMLWNIRFIYMLSDGPELFFRTIDLLYELKETFKNQPKEQQKEFFLEFYRIFLRSPSVTSFKIFLNSNSPAMTMFQTE